jgi:hypothetical protein
LQISSGLLLLDTSSNRLLAYNETARQAWECLERGLAAHEVADSLALHYGIPQRTALADVRAIFVHWQSYGLITAEGADQQMLPPPTSKAVADWAFMPKPQFAAIFTCTIRDQVFAFAVEGARDAANLQVVFRHLETPNARPDFLLEVRAAVEGETALVIDGIECMRTRVEEQLVGAINQIILERIYPGVEWLAMIHGGAVARNGKGLAFPAPSGSGKTTLIAYLLACGYKYFADDLIALSLPAGEVAPWPLPLSIKAGSWDVLSSIYPDLLSFPRYDTGRGECRQIVPPSTVWDNSHVPLKYVFFPRYVAGATANLAKLTPFEALERFLSDHIWLGYPIKEQRVASLLNWLEDTPAYSVVYGNFADAERCIRAVT